MNRTFSAGLVSMVGVMAISAPIVASIYFSNRQSLDTEMNSALALADEVTRRSDAVSSQVSLAFRMLQEGNQGSPCSAQRIARMREIAVSSGYLQGVGYVVGGRLICSSFGNHGAGLELGPVDYVDSLGIAIRGSVTLPIAPKLQFLIAEQYGYAAIVHRDIPLDVFVNNREVALGIASSSAGRVVLQRGALEPRWLLALPPGGAARFFDGSHVVALRRSRDFDLTAIAAVPEKYLIARQKELSMTLVPIGILAALALAAVLFFLVMQHISLPAIMRSSLKRDDFFLLYQPLVDLETRRCVGAEALLRWRRAGATPISPDLFIQVAEESGLIQRITDRVLLLIEREAPALVKRYPEIHVAINLAGVDLQTERIVFRLSGLLHRTEMKPHNLIVEATERGFINTSMARVVTRAIRTMGLRIAIDDFGTGYSSLSYLASFEVDYLKIDKSFIDTIGTEAATSRVVFHIIEMAKSLNLKIIAEGVETEMQAQFLRDHGVHFAQGWLFGKPTSMDELDKLLQGEKLAA